MTPIEDIVLPVVNELVRMEHNLSQMPADTRGHRQLARSIDRIKDHLQAHDFELPALLGTPYNDGMSLVADFALDESLPPGTQVITRVQQPQVNYRGRMIQVAHVTVSQNI